MNEYFKPEDIIFRLHRDTGEIIAVGKTSGKTHPFITGLIDTDNSAILELIDKLRIAGFAVSCDEPQARHIRHNIRKDSDGDIEFHCTDEGFTMRKCMYVDSGGRGNIKKKHKRSVSWRALSPNKKERTTMKKKCGKKCFIGRGMSFPVCAKKTCKINKKGMWAAFIKATRLNTKKKSYKIKGSTRRQKYSTIISKAQRGLSRKK